MTDEIEFYLDPEGIVEEEAEIIDFPDDPEADAVPTEEPEPMPKNDPVPL